MRTSRKTAKPRLNVKYHGIRNRKFWSNVYFYPGRDLIKQRVTRKNFRDWRGKHDEDDDGPMSSHSRSSSFSNSKSVSKLNAFQRTFKVLGPGLITGASDDDPSGIGTYSQAGAKFGVGMLWMALFLYPMILIIEEMCARIGLVTGKGLAFAIKKKYSRNLFIPLVMLLLIANTINIGADIGAMSASLRLVFPNIPFIIATLAFVGIILAAFHTENIQSFSNI